MLTTYNAAQDSTAYLRAKGKVNIIDSPNMLVIPDHRYIPGTLGGIEEQRGIAIVENIIKREPS